MKPEDLSIVAQEGPRVRSRIRECEVLIDSAAWTVTGSSVSATLFNINILGIVVCRRHLAYLEGSDVDLSLAAEELDIYLSVQIVDSWAMCAFRSNARC